MINISQLISLPLISIYDGQILGIVKNIRFNPKTNRATYAEILCEEDDSVKILNLKSVYKFGENSVLIKNKSALDLFEEKELEMSSLFNPITCPIFSIDGKFVGSVSDIILKNNLEINKILIDNNQEFSKQQIINFSNNCVIINCQDKKFKLCNFKCKQSFNILNFDEKVQIQPLSSTEIKDDTSQRKPHRVITDYRFLLNRTISKDIFNNNGELLAKANSKITTKTIETARNCGKLVELTHYSN